MAHANGPSPDREGSSDGRVGGPIRQDGSSHAQGLGEAIPSTAPSLARGASAAVTTVTTVVWCGLVCRGVDTVLYRRGGIAGGGGARAARSALERRGGEAQAEESENE